MGIEHIKHRMSYRLSVIIGLVLSGMVVTLASLIGRGSINLKSALIKDEPTDVTVIAIVEPKLTDGTKITGINFLRKESQGENAKPLYDYYVTTSEDTPYFVRLRFDASSNQWQLLTFETLHPDADLKAVP